MFLLRRSNNQDRFQMIIRTLFIINLMGECSSTCRTICEQHKKISNNTSNSQIQRRQIILLPNPLLKQKKNIKTDVNSTPQIHEEKESKVYIQTFPSHSTEQSLNRQIKTQERIGTQSYKQSPVRNDEKSELEQIHFVKQDKPIATKKKSSLYGRQQHSMNYSINASYLMQMHSASPKLILPSEVHDSLIERWNESSYQPSKLFRKIDYDAIFDKND